jgi:hypothetical protein
MLEMKSLNYPNLGKPYLVYYDLKKCIYLCWYVLCYVHYLIRALKVRFDAGKLEARIKQHSNLHSL